MDHHSPPERRRGTTPSRFVSANRTAPADDRLDHDLYRLDDFQLPARVNVRVHDAWRPGWLIGYDHQPSGWWGLVQYRDDHCVEATEWLAADRISPAERGRHQAE